MSTTTNLNQTLDGINPIDTLGTPRNWDVVQSGPTYGFLGYLSNRNNTADDELIADVSVTGTNWQIVTLRYSAAFDNTTTLHDLDAQTGRRIKYLELGANSDVDLISTRVDFIVGGNGLLHDVKLGAAKTTAITLYADQNNIETGSGYVSAMETDGTADITIRGGGAGTIGTSFGDDTVNTFGGYVAAIFTNDGDDTVKIGGGGAGYVNLGDGSNTFMTKVGWVDAAKSHNGNNDISIGTGGIGQLTFSTDGGTYTTQTINADGWVGSLLAFNNTQVMLTFGNDGGGSVRLSDRDDTVTLGAGFVETINTKGGNDTVTLGSGGAVFIRLGSGDDTLFVTNQPADNLLNVNAQGGVDTIDFGGSGTSLIFSLNLKGAWQYFDGISYIQATGFENVTGSKNDDVLKGDDGSNHLSGAKGADTLRGFDGADILEGGRGRDRMFAGIDSDQDTFRFNDVNETFLGKYRDRLFNFESGEDLIDLAGIDADTTTGGNQTFAFNDTTAAAHSVWYTVNGANVVVSADTDGDALADFVVAVVQVASLTAGDFIL